MTESAWKDFEAWCEAAGEHPEPPDWPTLIRYIRELGRGGEPPRTIRFRLEALGEVYQERGLDDPTAHERVWGELKQLDTHHAASQTPDSPRNPGPGEANVALQTISEPALEPVETSQALPPVLAGHETPAVREAVGRFYASVHAMLEAWLARRQSPNTRRAYRRDILDFVQFLGVPITTIEVDGRSVQTVHPDHGWQLLKATVPQVQAWRDFLSVERDAAPNTLNRRVSSVSGFYRFMREAAAEARLPITVSNPAHSQFISREVQEPVSPTEALTATRARQLMSLPEGESQLAYRDRAVLKFYLYTGSRIGTGCRLNVEDFIDDEEDPKVRIQEKGRGKSKRAVGINAIAADALREYIAHAGLSSGPLFRPRLSSRSEQLAPRAMDVSTMYRLLQNYLERVPRSMKEHELADGSTEVRCIYTPHSIRATTATLLLDAGEDIRDVQKLLGHKHVTVTQVYDKRRRGTKDSASHRLAL